jgi:hypothetical protein
LPLLNSAERAWIKIKTRVCVTGHFQMTVIVADPPVTITVTVTFLCDRDLLCDVTQTLMKTGFPKTGSKNRRFSVFEI